jgi:hypothetical protein
MTQYLLQCFNVTCSHGEVACKSMAQVFDPEIVNPCPSAHGFKSTLDIPYPFTFTIHNNIL